MDDTTLVKVRDSAEDSTDEICGIPVVEEGKVKSPSRNAMYALFIVVALGADTIK